MRYRHSLGEEITVKKNQIHAILASYGIIIKATDPFGKKGLKEIENNYNNLNYSELLDGYMLIRKYSHIFFISAEQVDGKASFTGPDRNTALKMLEGISSFIVL